VRGDCEGRNLPQVSEGSSGLEVEDVGASGSRQASADFGKAGRDTDLRGASVIVSAAEDSRRKRTLGSRRTSRER